MEVQILHYYLRAFSIITISLFILLIVYTYYTLNKEVEISNNLIKINKGENIEKIIYKNFKNHSLLDIFIIKKYYQITNLFFKKFIHYGEFKIENNISIINLLNIISKPSNYIKKITIIEGWSKKDLNLELSKYFTDVKNIPYENIIADTYYFNNNTTFDAFINELKKFKIEYFSNYNKNKISELYTNNEIMIIGSLLEKEGLDYEDKRKISSVIFNRLNKKMKLQIDATVIFALTNDQYELNRKLLIEDLKISHPYNTYLYHGLPPKPISYVGKKTIDIIFENYQTDFLFYFFNNSLNRHIFSKNFEDHKFKLNEYRSKK